LRDGQFAPEDRSSPGGLGLAEEAHEFHSLNRQRSISIKMDIGRVDDIQGEAAVAHHRPKRGDREEPSPLAIVPVTLPASQSPDAARGQG